MNYHDPEINPYDDEEEKQFSTFLRALLTGILLMVFIYGSILFFVIMCHRPAENSRKLKTKNYYEKTNILHPDLLRGNSEFMRDFI